MDIEHRAFMLMEMFPEASYEVILNHLLQNEGDLEKTSESLLSEELILKSAESWVIDSSSERNMINETRLMELTDLSLDEITEFLRQNNEDGPRALVDMVTSYEKKYKESVRKHEENKKKYPSKVQSNYTNKEDEPYTYREGNPEVNKLAMLVFNDSQLVNINWNFCIDLLIFCNGKVDRAIAVVIYLVENDAVQLTYDCYSKTVGPLDPGDIPPDIQESMLDYTNIPSGPIIENDFQLISKEKKYGPPRQLPIQQTTQLKRHPQLNRNDVLQIENRQEELMDYELENCKKTNRLDLHGFHTDTAKVTVQMALKQWWADELKARSDSGTEGLTIQARHVESLTIITGRGSHSEDGIPRVKIQVEKLLQKSPYKYSEQSSSFVVYGKK
jgi:DNA-nicking Smr family endonuclease